MFAAISSSTPGIYSCEQCIATRVPEFRRTRGCPKLENPSPSRYPIEALGLTTNSCPSPLIHTPYVNSVLQLHRAKEENLFHSDYWTLPVPVEQSLLIVSNALRASRQQQLAEEGSSFGQ